MKHERDGWKTLAVAQRIWLELARQRRSLLFWIVFPVLVLLSNRYLLTHYLPMSAAEAFARSAPATVVGVALFLSVFWGSMGTIAAERSQQTFKRLCISPLSPLSYLLGVFTAYSCIGIGQTLLIYALALLGGANFKGSMGWSGLVVVLAIAAYWGGGLVIGTQVAANSNRKNILIFAIGGLLLLWGGGLLPPIFLPDFLLNLAIVNPIYHMNAALTGISVFGQEVAEIVLHLVFLLGFTVLLLLLGGWSYRRLLRLEGRL